MRSRMVWDYEDPIGVYHVYDADDGDEEGGIADRFYVYLPRTADNSRLIGDFVTALNARIAPSSDRKPEPST